MNHTKLYPNDVFNVKNESDDITVAWANYAQAEGKKDGMEPFNQELFKDLVSLALTGEKSSSKLEKFYGKSFEKNFIQKIESKNYDFNNPDDIKLCIGGISRFVKHQITNYEKFVFEKIKFDFFSECIKEEVLRQLRNEELEQEKVLRQMENEQLENDKILNQYYKKLEIEERELAHAINEIIEDDENWEWLDDEYWEEQFDDEYWEDDSNHKYLDGDFDHKYWEDELISRNGDIKNDTFGIAPLYEIYDCEPPDEVIEEKYARREYTPSFDSILEREEFYQYYNLKQLEYIARDMEHDEILKDMEHDEILKDMEEEMRNENDILKLMEELYIENEKIIKKHLEKELQEERDLKKSIDKILIEEFNNKYCN